VLALVGVSCFFLFAEAGPDLGLFMDAMRASWRDAEAPGKTNMHLTIPGDYIVYRVGSADVSVSVKGPRGDLALEPPSGAPELQRLVAIARFRVDVGGAHVLRATVSEQDTERHRLYVIRAAPDPDPELEAYVRDASEARRRERFGRDPWVRERKFAPWVGGWLLALGGLLWWDALRRRKRTAS